MIRVASALWWGLTLALLPVVLPQALWTKRTALRLPPAAGDAYGLAGVELAGPCIKLLLVGESTVAGVGVELHEAALAAQLARALSLRWQRPVAWRACGENGVTAQQATERLLPQALAEPVDLALLVFGVNDSTHLSSLNGWDQSVRALARPLLQQGIQVAFTGVPPLEHFSALPWLLRRLLGLRACLLDSHLRGLCEQLGASHHSVQLQFSVDYLAVDGYHPSVLGYQVWAQSLAEQLPMPGASGGL